MGPLPRTDHRADRGAVGAIPADRRPLVPGAQTTPRGGVSAGHRRAHEPRRGIKPISALWQLDVGHISHLGYRDMPGDARDWLRGRP